jgi:hypothetical protein
MTEGLCICSLLPKASLVSYHSKRIVQEAWDYLVHYVLGHRIRRP